MSCRHYYGLCFPHLLVYCSDSSSEALLSSGKYYTSSFERKVDFPGQLDQAEVRDRTRVDIFASDSKIPLVLNPLPATEKCCLVELAPESETP